MSSKNKKAKGGLYKVFDEGKAEEFALNASDFGVLYGSGELHKIQRDSRAQIDVVGNKGEQGKHSEKLLVIQGSKEAKASALSMLETFFTPSLHLTKSEVGFLLGGGGGALCAIEKEFKMLIQVRGSRDDPTRPVIITGTAEVKAKVVQAIRAALGRVGQSRRNSHEASEKEVMVEKVTKKFGEQVDTIIENPHLNKKLNHRVKWRNKIKLKSDSND